ncbi:3'-5' exonuclease [Fusarium flagelliforme]|uniref:3'-5' exonuclease n=1 Tax=Fusarium flagelliforme TaxID=2675880 RepID=A0A395M6C7_9HYPO|nr:3'-5' exonuclease [Fusarium flagelliforme]
MDVITKKLETTSLKLGPLVVWVDNEATVSKLVDTLDGLKKGPASIFIDLEGVNLSRHGTISIMQIYDAVDKCVYLVDIHTLGAKCFSTPGKDHRTLKHVLEDENTVKVFFDVRNDSDALYAHFKIDLAGIHDLQLMEVATRTYNRRLLNGLAKCIDRDAPLTERERENMLDVKAKGRALFLPEQGGSYEVFNQRPLPDSLKLYCVHDVQVLPRLYDYYDKKMSDAWRRKVLDVSVERVSMSHRADYVTSGRFMAFAPASWVYGKEV